MLAASEVTGHRLIAPAVRSMLTDASCAHMSPEAPVLYYAASSLTDISQIAHVCQTTWYSHAGNHLEDEPGASGAEEWLGIRIAHARHAKAKWCSVVIELIQRRSIVRTCAAREEGFQVGHAPVRRRTDCQQPRACQLATCNPPQCPPAHFSTKCISRCLKRSTNMVELKIACRNAPCTVLKRQEVGRLRMWGMCTSVRQHDKSCQLASKTVNDRMRRERAAGSAAASRKLPRKGPTAVTGTQRKLRKHALERATTTKDASAPTAAVT